MSFSSVILDLEDLPGFPRSERERLLAEGKADDEILLKELEEGGVPDDEAFFRKCLTGRLPKTSKMLLARDNNR